VIPHDCKKCSTGHHLGAHKSSPTNQTCLTHLGMKPHERNYYKSTHITQSESPQKHVLTVIVWVQKIESNHIIAKNAAQVITCEQTGHHKKIRQFWST